MVLKQKGVSVGNTFLESLNRKCSSTVTNFVLGSAEASRGYPIIYCSDGFCRLSGFSRQEILGNNCDCSLLCSVETSTDTIIKIKEAMRTKTELKTEIHLSKKDGTPFKCLVDFVPIRNEAGEVVFFLISHKEIVDICSFKRNGKTKDSQSVNTTTTAKTSTTTTTTGDTKMRKFSRDVLLHFHKRYYGPSSQTDNVRTAGNVESQLLPEYKLEDTVIPMFMLLHFGRLRLIWDWIILVIVSYQAIVIPFIVSFEVHNNVKFYVTDVLLEFMFIFDVILNFRTTYINQKSGRLVTSPKEIAMHYLTTWFALDFIATFPFDLLYFIRNDWSKIVNMLKLKRLLRLFRFARRVSKYIEYTTTLLLLMMFSFALLSHWLACIWYVIGYKELQLGERTGWLYRLGKQINKPYNNGTTSTAGGPSHSEQYISSLYFVFTSLTTVGFGNISPNTVAEKIFSIIVLMLGAIVQSAIFGNMTAAIQKLYASRARFHAKASQIKQFVRIHDIDEDLKKRIEDWFISHWSISKGVNTEEMLETFPNELQADICLHLYKAFLTLPCFLNTSRGCLRSISVIVKKAYYSPGELIIKEKDAINSLFFVQRGTVEIAQKDFIVAIIGTGDLFGEDICQPKKKIKCSNGDVKALMYCEILYLTRDGIRDVISCYPDFPKHFSRNIVLAFDLSGKKLDPSNKKLSLGAIEEEDQADVISVTSSSLTSTSEESDNEAVTCDGSSHSNIKKKKSTPTKKRSSARKSATTIPLWQLKLTSESPSPSVKSRLRKLEDLNTSSSSDVAVSDNIDNNSMNKNKNDNNDTNSIYELSRKRTRSTIAEINSLSIDSGDVETSFIHNSSSNNDDNNNINNNNNNNNRTSPTLCYTDISKSSNLYLDNVIENCDAADASKLPPQNSSKPKPKSESSLYRSKSTSSSKNANDAASSENWQHSRQRMSHTSPPYSECCAFHRRKTTFLRKMNSLRRRHQNHPDKSHFSYNSIRTEEGTVLMDDCTPREQITTLQHENEASLFENEAPLFRNEASPFYRHESVSEQPSNSTVNTFFPSPTRQSLDLQDGEFEGEDVGVLGTEPCAIIIDPISGYDVYSPQTCIDHLVNSCGEANEEEEDAGKDRLGFFISDQDMSHCSGYSSFYEKSENELDTFDGNSYYGKGNDNDDSNINPLGNWVNDMQVCVAISDDENNNSKALSVTENNKTTLEGKNPADFEDSSLSQLAACRSLSSAENTMLGGGNREFHQIKKQMNNLQNEMHELKSGMSVLTELVRLSLNNNQLQKNL